MCQASGNGTGLQEGKRCWHICPSCCTVLSHGAASSDGRSPDAPVRARSLLLVWGLGKEQQGHEEGLVCEEYLDSARSLISSWMPTELKHAEQEEGRSSCVNAFPFLSFHFILKSEAPSDPVSQIGSQVYVGREGRECNLK